MNLMLTSFDPFEQNHSIFYRMPPVSTHTVAETLVPDFASLMLCEKLIMDEASFVILQEKPHPLYTTVAEMTEILHAEGFIELVDFSRILDKNQSLLNLMLEYDLVTMDSWVEPLKDSINIWSNFLSQASKLILKYQNPRNRQLIGYLHNASSRQVTVLGNLELWDLERNRIEGGFEPKDKSGKFLKRVLKPYLSYINSTIVLSNELGVGFHDWADYLPFYKRKFAWFSDRQSDTQKHIEASQNLFELSFPELSINNSTKLLKILHDKRVEDLRKLVDDATNGKIHFDQEFARRTLWEVLGTERKTAKYQKFISYLTLPLDFLPWIGTAAQLIADEGIGLLVEKKLKQKYQWFYLLSDIANIGKEA